MRSATVSSTRELRSRQSDLAIAEADAIRGDLPPNGSTVDAPTLQPTSSTTPTFRAPRGRSREPDPLPRPGSDGTMVDTLPRSAPRIPLSAPVRRLNSPAYTELGKQWYTRQDSNL
ncbi:MAG: hypothetical protein DHS20C15_24400 [Planctomycetota bacterium]|nr:MAG: hypothetical protein DHS20C15_24400 [Planctomycetota bacterium]